MTEPDAHAEAVETLQSDLEAREGEAERTGPARASYCRSLVARVATPPRSSPPRALSAAERFEVLQVLHEPRFVDLAAAEPRGRAVLLLRPPTSRTIGLGVVGRMPTPGGTAIPRHVPQVVGSAHTPVNDESV